MKKVLSLVLALIFVVSMLPVAFAAENEVIIREISREIIYLDDGYSIEAIEYEHIYPHSARATETITRSRENIYRDATGTKLYSLTLTATFSFTGTFARATSSSYSHYIYKNLYHLGSGNSYTSDNYAVATGTFYDSLGNRHRTLSITASCDVDGNVTFSLSNYY